MNWFDVMERLENGDSKAFDQLRKLIRNKLFRMRRRSLDNVEDVVQDTVISILNAWRRGCIRDVHCFEGFVWRLAERRLTDAWNRQTRPGAPDCVGDPELAIGANAITAKDPREYALDLTRALEQLADANRRAVGAIYLEGRTYLEASAHLGLPLGTFKRKLGDGLKKIRASLV